MHADVLVVGASVGGVSTALQLARRGFRVVVADKETFPREKPCGEGLMPHGVAALKRLGVLAPLLETAAPRFSGIAFHVGGTTAEGVFPNGRLGMGYRRHRLDPILLAACEREPGVTLRTGARVKQLRRTAIGWEADAGGVVSARLVIGADGLHSMVRKTLGLEGKRPKRARYGLRRHFFTGQPVRDKVDVFLADKGIELYVTPVGPQEVNVAILCERSTAQSLTDLNQGVDWCIQQVPQVNALLGKREPINEAAMTGPLRQQATDVVADRAALVGDAAGFIDALSGEGMSITLLSSEILADVVSKALSADRLEARHLRPYAKRRTRETRDLLRLTELLLWGMKYRTLAKHVVGNLRRHPKLFGHVLAINSGERRLLSLRPGELRRLLVG